MSEIIIHRIYFAEDIKTGRAKAACICGWSVDCPDLLTAQLKASIHDLELEDATDGTPNEKTNDRPVESS